MCLKEGRVKLLHKFGDMMDIKNYRLISILPAISKFFDKIMNERLYSIFDEKNMFYPTQFGFCSKRSTIDALVEVTAQIRGGSTGFFYVYIA